MTNLEDLIRIQKANDILNRGFEKIGAKPLMIDIGYEGNSPKRTNSSFEFNFKPQIDLLEQVNHKLKEEKKKKLSKIIRNDFRDNQQSKLRLALIVVITLIFIYSMFYISSHNTNLVNFPEDALAESAGTKSYVITSGTFKYKSEAKSYSRDLSTKLGVPLKLIKINNYYTIQIGPNYENQEDILLVFDELTRYSIRDLSVKEYSNSSKNLG